MTMNGILFGELPCSVTVAGEEFPINTDFRCMAEFEHKIMTTHKNDGKRNSETFINTLKKFYKENIPHDINEAIKKMWWFYRCGESINNRINTFGNTSRNVRLYDYEIDAPRIAAAFKNQYGIDLTCCSLHWWLFKAYMSSLNSDCDFVKIMGYRSMDLKKIRNAQERNRYKKLQEYYKLPEIKTVPMTKEERDAAFRRNMIGR